MKNAYSYVRLSSKRQLTGAGVERQLAKPEDICRHNGWKLSAQTFSDLGVSAFKGKNRLKGDLGTFIGLAKAGRLLPEPVLIIEAFDRFSRQDIDESEPVIIDLLKTGVAIHVAFVNKTFSKDSTKSLADRIEILISLKSAFDYSANLSRRVKDAKQRKLAAIQNGEVKNISEFAPSYFDWNKTRRCFERNARSEIVERMFDEYLSGFSLCKIAKGLNSDRIPSFEGRQWSRATLRYILGNRAAVGEFKGKALFPVLITPERFERAQALLERNRNRRGHEANQLNIFRGIIGCAGCGHSVQVSRNKGRHYAYYRCHRHNQADCPQRQMLKVCDIERVFFTDILRADPQTLLAGDDGRTRERLELLKLRRGALERKISLLLELDGEFHADEIKTKFATVKAQQTTLDKEIATLESQTQLAASPDVLRNIRELLSAPETTEAEDDFLQGLCDQLERPEVRQQLQVLLPSLVKRIGVDFNARKLRVELTNGKRQMVDLLM